MPRFTIRDLLWAMALVAAVCAAAGWIVGRNSADERLERLIHKIDQDVHGHLRELSEWIKQLEARPTKEGR